MIAGEKRTLKDLLELIELGLKLLEMKSLEEAKKCYSEMKPNPAHNYYVERVLFNLKWE